MNNLIILKKSLFSKSRPLFKLFTYFLLFFCAVLQSCSEDPFDADSGTYTDKRDGNVYQWIKIGDQIWMAENLAYIPYVCAPDSQCGIWVYDYSGEGSYGSNLSIYGCLYDWETAMEVCPEGWHLPSDEEWMELERFLGIPEDELYTENIFRGVDANSAEKLGAGSSLWNDPNEYSTNETGFSLKPSGMRLSDGRFRSIGDEASFWTSTYDENRHATIQRAINSQGILRYAIYEREGLSARYIKD